MNVNWLVFIFSVKWNALVKGYLKLYYRIWTCYIICIFENTSQLIDFRRGGGWKRINTAIELQCLLCTCTKYVSYSLDENYQTSVCNWLTFCLNNRQRKWQTISTCIVHSFGWRTMQPYWLRTMCRTVPSPDCGLFCK